MKHLYLSVRTHSPLATRAGHAESGAKPTQYIAGTTLLGCLAEAHRLLRPKDEEEFATLFLQQRVLFPHLYPAFFTYQEMNRANTPVMPLPKTAQTCKRFAGFRPWSKEDTDEEQHGIRDSLLDWTTFALLDSPGQAPATLIEPFQSSQKCQICKQAMDHARGHYRCNRKNPSQRMLAETHKHLQMHTGINREWGTVEEKILYNREVFDQGMPFWGEIILPDELAQTLKSLISEAEKEGVVHMGTGRTRGMGKILLRIRDAEDELPSEDHAASKKRLLAFDCALKERASEAASAPFYLAMTLHSPSILRDPFLRYYSTIDGMLIDTLLRPYLPQGYPAITWQRIYQATEAQSVYGWNELWGTPRPIDYALEAGSTFVFSCSQALDDTLAQALYALEEEGIGRRRAEGFGRIRFADPFHLEGEQV